MNAEERNAILGQFHSVSAQCLLCGNANPPAEDFSFSEFWVRDKKDWPNYQGGPVHRICADRQMKA